MKVHSEGNSALVEEIILIVTIIVKDQHVNCLMRHVLRYLVGGVSLAFIDILRTEKWKQLIKIKNSLPGSTTFNLLFFE